MSQCECVGSYVATKVYCCSPVAMFNSKTLSNVLNGDKVATDVAVWWAVMKKITVTSFSWHDVLLAS